MDAKSTFDKNISNIFAFRNHNQYINFFDLFLLKFNFIPNSILEDRINCTLANNHFAKKYKDQIKERYYRKMVLEPGEAPEDSDVFYVLDNMMVVFFVENNESYFLFNNDKTDMVNGLINELLKFKKNTKTSHEIYLLINASYGIDTKSLKITKPKLQIEDNYNEDFIPVHQNILNRLSKKNDKGIVLLHGKPGTGKTSYIRYLITSISKKVIFLPPNMAIAITNPDFLGVLIENPNSVLVIEDAENIILDREQNGSSAVSTLLNLSDGLLSDCLNIQVICSFNTDISKIDAALMRKGRLIAKYQFKELEIEKAQKLSNKLGFESKINQPTLLTDIYNQKDSDFQEDKKKIGF